MVRHTPKPAAFLLEYRDGFRATVLMLNGYVKEQVRSIAAVAAGMLHWLVFGSSVASGHGPHHHAAVQRAHTL